MRRIGMAAAAALAPVTLLLTLSLSTACGGGDATPPDASIDGNPGGQTYTLHWGPVEVAPGEEDTRCVTLRLGNDFPIKVHEIHNTLSPGSHHFIVYRLADGVEDPTPTPCFPFVDTLDPTKGAPLMITQRSDETLELPPGVAFSLAANQMVRLEMHFINTSPTETISVEATSEVHVMADADFQQDADFLFIGNPDIQLPPQAGVTQTLGPTYFPMPATLADVNIFAITGHTHALGTDVRVETVADGTGPGSSIYAPDPFNWNRPIVSPLAKI